MRDRLQNKRLQNPKANAFLIMTDVWNPSVRQQAQLEWTKSVIHELNTRFTLWTTGYEFGTVKGTHAIVHILTIRDAQTGEIVVSTPVDYNQIELDEPEQQLSHYHSVIQGRSGDMSPYCQCKYFAQHYSSTTID